MDSWSNKIFEDFHLNEKKSKILNRFKEWVHKSTWYVSNSRIKSGKITLRQVKNRFRNDGFHKYDLWRKYPTISFFKEKS